MLDIGKTNWNDEFGLKPHEVQNFLWKGGGTPKPPDPLREAEGQLMIERARQQFEREQAAEAQRLSQEERARTEAKEATAKAEKERRFSDTLGSTYNSAKGYGQQKVNSLGVPDSWGLLDQYTNALDTAKGGVPHLSENVSSYLNPNSIWNEVSGNVRTGQRNRLSTDWSGRFGTGFESREDFFADSLDDPYLNEIINEQKTDAQLGVERARARGTLNDAGLGYANKELSRQGIRANAKASDFGDSVLDRYRSQLTDYAGNVKNRIGNWDFGTDLNLDTESNYIQGLVGKNRGRLQGDILNTMGDTQLFDINAILGKAGTMQGPTNTPAASILANAATGMTDEDKKKKANIGVI